MWQRAMQKVILQAVRGEIHWYRARMSRVRLPRTLPSPVKPRERTKSSKGHLHRHPRPLDADPFFIQHDLDRGYSPRPKTGPALT
jgi:hypothetical protein